MLGTSLIQALAGVYETISVSRYPGRQVSDSSVAVDLADRSAAHSVVETVRPDIIIHCAALADVDACENDYASAYAIHADATAYLAEALGTCGRFIYMSTDSVFDGRRGMYREDDKPNPLNNYARTKLEGERAVSSRLKNHLIVRANMIGHRPAGGGSLAEWVVGNLRSGTPICMFTDVLFSPLDMTTLAALIMRLVGSDVTGCIHLGSRDGVSKYDLGCRLAERMGLDTSLITPVSVSSANFRAPRPLDTTLNVSKAQRILGAFPAVYDELGCWCDQERVRRPVL
jgi:dTDP-4-dehydrorhamnose reductase